MMCTFVFSAFFVIYRRINNGYSTVYVHGMYCNTEKFKTQQVIGQGA